jgi:hypothetical protein
VVITIGCNQDRETIIGFESTAMVRKKDHAPEIPRSRVGDRG